MLRNYDPNKPVALPPNILAAFDYTQKAIGPFSSCLLVGGTVISILLSDKEKLKECRFKDLDFVTGHFNLQKAASLGFYKASFKKNLYSFPDRNKSNLPDFGAGIDVFDMQGKTIYEDFENRDFTICALYMDSLGRVYDPTGRGLKDLAEKKLEMIGDAKEKFKADPIRVIRAIKYMLAGFEPSENVAEALRTWTLPEHCPPHFFSSLHKLCKPSNEKQISEILKKYNLSSKLKLLSDPINLEGKEEFETKDQENENTFQNQETEKLKKEERKLKKKAKMLEIKKAKEETEQKEKEEDKKRKEEEKLAKRKALREQRKHEEAQKKEITEPLPPVELNKNEEPKIVKKKKKKKKQPDKINNKILLEMIEPETKEPQRAKKKFDDQIKKLMENIKKKIAKNSLTIPEFNQLKNLYKQDCISNEIILNNLGQQIEWAFQFNKNNTLEYVLKKFQENYPELSESYKNILNNYLISFIKKAYETNPNECNEYCMSIISILIQNGADPNLTNDGDTLLCDAIKKDRYRLSEILLIGNANPDLPSPNGATPLYHAVSKECDDTIILLHAYDVNPNNELGSNQFKPIFEAIRRNNWKIVDALLEIGSNPCTKNEAGIDAIEFARRKLNINSQANPNHFNLFPPAQKNISDILSEILQYQCDRALTFLTDMVEIDPELVSQVKQNLFHPQNQ